MFKGSLRVIQMDLFVGWFVGLFVCLFVVRLFVVLFCFKIWFVCVCVSCFKALYGLFGLFPFLSCGGHKGSP